MEKITNYKLSQFFALQDIETVDSYMSILDLLRPINHITNPKYHWFNKEPKTLPIKPVMTLSFGEVISLRKDFNNVTQQAIFEAIKLVTGLSQKSILNLRIIDFYSIISTIKQQLIDISNMEINELSPDENQESNVDSQMVRADERMARFGELNTINFITGKDITKWAEIQKLPYLTVFTWLIMNKEQSAIQKDIEKLQKNRNKN